jgi:hypothetical protein
VEYLAGVALALAAGRAASLVGLDRDRALYPTVMIVIATYYALFAVMASSVRALVSELVVIAAFLVAAVAGFKRTLWIVVAALLAHSVFDFVHEHLISNPGVPSCGRRSAWHMIRQLASTSDGCSPASESGQVRPDACAQAPRRREEL